MLSLTRKLRERIIIKDTVTGDVITISVNEISRHQVKLGIQAPAHIIVDREEIHLQRQAKLSGQTSKILHRLKSKIVAA